ncbi:MAG: SGNH/GDSL hydrolase family protein [Kiritimatiellae bacterium]|nr:SGNH/GDSL hydrolase family protein [Kiritimatiellia bacterium]
MNAPERRPAWRRALALVCFLVAACALGLVALIAWKGGRWTGAIGGLTVSAGNPCSRLWLAAAALLAGRLLWSGLPRDRGAWARLAGRLLLLAVSLWGSWRLGEWALRRALRANESSGDLRELEAFNEGEDIAVKAAHALAAITRVSPNKGLAYELKPNLDMDFGHRSLKTNSDGMRESREYSKEKPADTLRIIGIGDSGMFGWACHQGENYLDALENRLADRPGPLKYEVLNLAVPGYNTYQEVELLRYKGLAYSPDIVIVGWCENDLLPPFFLMKQRAYDERGVSYLYLLLFSREEFRRRTQPEVMRLDEVDPRYVAPEILENSGPEGVLKSLRELKRLSEERGFRVLVFGPMVPEIVTACRREGLECWSSFTLRQEDYPDANIHGMHPRPKANLILAEHLEKELDRLGWLGGASAALPAAAADEGPSRLQPMVERYRGQKLAVLCAQQREEGPVYFPEMTSILVSEFRRAGLECMDLGFELPSFDLQKFFEAGETEPALDAAAGGRAGVIVAALVEPGPGGLRIRFSVNSVVRRSTVWSGQFRESLAEDGAPLAQQAAAAWIAQLRAAAPEVK